MTTPDDIEAIRPLTAEELAQWRDVNPAGAHFRPDLIKRFLATIDALSAPVTREVLIEALLSCDGPPIMQPAMRGYEERLERWHRGCREMAEKRADAILERIPGGQVKKPPAEEK